ncbi:NO signaling/Golgi transport ligand-binding domain-containing protein [Suillus paluster]|uniref:NO signaling/Golgi transport ligand-binding domain-containing protein n=1 Tax=Suillus paluster TaxID=48578 RepID=UPI001B86F266|nr:NO signaling/Golgi transport ligand-binding domain-containing protein [Suillus paluster]KAG1725575.1 NO signaling/Golgi transport ligand-binding domain-containing protein [Suillus paluster]
MQATPSSALSTLADPPARMVDGAAMDYFLIEVVNALRVSSAVAAARASKTEREMVEAGLVPPPPPAKQQNPRDSASSTTGKISGPTDEEEGVRSRLEVIGMHVGGNFAERLCRDRPLFGDSLDVIKFVCKDLWTSCWDKQVDNLRTNHRGVYVLQDNAFKPIARISSWEGRQEALRRAKLYVALPAGIIRGALSRVGLHGTVVPEITTLPQCTFQIKLPKNT